MVRRLNLPQRVVLVAALGAGLGFFGLWLTTPGSFTGWVAYAPLSNTAIYASPGIGFHPWVRLLIWLALIAIWALVSLWLLRERSGSRERAVTG